MPGSKISRFVAQRRKAGILACGLCAAWLLNFSVAEAAAIPSPESHLGFRPGADNRLASWSQVVAYFDKVDAASERVKVRVLGETTEKRPYLVAFVSSAANLKDLDRYLSLQAKLSDPRKIPSETDRRETLAESKPVVVITCSIHSTETASTLMATELLYEMASRDDPATLEILDRTILVLVPSANPDGVDKVASWYERTKGHPWEGSGMPELYHKYAGHDTNRDWFMLNLKETRLLTRLLYKELFPTLLYDVHQMGSKGARLFVPPFYDPINPNLDPRLNQGISLIGAHMAYDLAASGKRGVLTHAMYDNWWNGGNRTTPQRHNIVAVLTEAASVKMATPIFVDKDDLKATARGFTEHRPSVNFVDPWPGGWWRLRDIVDYELICARSLLTLAARYGDSLQSNLLAMASDAVTKGTTTPPYAWVVPRDQRDPGSVARLVGILHDSGIEVRQAREAFQAAGASFPAGTWILPTAQPYRPHLNDMMERQNYPTRLTAGGKAEAPYDVAGWTLPLQMGVRVVEAGDKISVSTELLDGIETDKGKLDAPEGSKHLSIANTANDDFTVRNALVSAGVPVYIVAMNDGTVKDSPPVGALWFQADAKSRSVLDEVLPTVSTRVVGIKEMSINESHVKSRQLSPERIAVYQPWMPSMDEGWTRFALETFKIPFKTVHNEDIRAGRLKERFDRILIPSVEAKVLRNGYGENETEPAYVGGLGSEGVAALRAFMRDGGTLVCLDASCEFAIDELDLPVKSLLKGLPTSEFYGPGSILRATPLTGTRLTDGVPDEISVYFDQSLAFDVKSGSGVLVALRYTGSNPLESGWLLGPDKIAGKAALVEIPIGKGAVILFGFPPQHRAQTHGTYRLLFNALLN